jgi:hypothetical protein
MERDQADQATNKPIHQFIHGIGFAELASPDYLKRIHFALLASSPLLC